MKTQFEVLPEMPRNEDRFSDPFFSRFNLRPADQPLELTSGISRNYRFPTFYSDVTCAIGIFMCSYEKASAVLPHPKMKPVRMPGKRALVAFSCYEYKNVYQVWPYNEISMMIPVLMDPKLDVPVLPMVAPKLFPSLGYYVFSMPVTSEENRIRGNRIWGLPKVTQDIRIGMKDGICETTAYERSGEPYFTLRVPMEGKKTHFDVGSNVYSKLNDRTLSSETNFKADFAVNKYMKCLFRKDLKPERRWLEIGNTPSCSLLKDLEIEEHPFQFRFAKGMNAAFDLAKSERTGNA